MQKGIDTKLNNIYKIREIIRYINDILQAIINHKLKNILSI